jgi:hypothetical protein
MGATLLALSSATARADGDPASDTLIFQNVFLPYPTPPAEIAKPLSAAVRDVYAKGRRIKVAVIGAPQDLGSVPSLFDKPKEYAQFLGTELGLYYIGPLLIVMPAGYGIYDGGRTVAAEEDVLAHLQPAAPTGDALVQAAAGAVQKLLKARALESKDIKAPYAQPFDATGHRGQAMKLRYMVFDDSGRARVHLEVRVGGKGVATFDRPLQQVSGQKTYTVPWTVPASLPVAPAKLCVTGIDPAGNKSKPACGPLRIG